MVIGASLIARMSLLLLGLTHPAILAGILGCYALVVRGLLALGTTRWFMYMLVLVFLGGVIVLIAYTTTLAANEKFFFYSRSISIRSLLVLLVVGSLASINSNHTGRVDSGFRGSVLAELFSARACLPYIFCVLLLLIVLIGVVKIVKLERGPLAKRL